MRNSGYMLMLTYDRYTPGSGYLEALVAENSTVIHEEIDHIDTDGLVVVGGQRFDVDAIVTATGFDCSFRPLFPVIGTNGRDLRTYWADEPLHYLSVAAPGFPNYFSTLRPEFSLEALTCTSARRTKQSHCQWFADIGAGS
jgi:cation diffusion facilitator CzcD-associated flavoprotein CzcO